MGFLGDVPYRVQSGSRVHKNVECAVWLHHSQWAWVIYYVYTIVHYHQHVVELSRARHLLARPFYVVQHTVTARSI